MSSYYNVCDHYHGRTNDTHHEIRRLPTGGGGAVLVCHEHYLVEMAFRRERIARGINDELPAWEDLSVYQEKSRWKEVTEKQWWYGLEVLPPIYGHNDDFAVGEAVRHILEDGRWVPTYDIYVKRFGKYYMTEGTVKELRSLKL